MQMVLGVVSVRCARREAASSPALAARAWRQRSACGAVAREDLGGAGVGAGVLAAARAQLAELFLVVEQARGEEAAAGLERGDAAQMR